MTVKDLQQYIHGDKDAFITKLNSICDKLGISSDWLIAIMYNESGLNPAAVNQKSGATGLIQFMPATAKALGTSTYELKSMSSLNQLDYVYKYFKPYSGKIDNIQDCYLCIFFPAALNKPDSYIFHTDKLSAKTIAAQNPGFDINKDGQITKAEFFKWVDAYMKKKTYKL